MAFKKIPLTIDTMIRNPVPVEGINQEDNIELNIVVTENKTPKDLSGQTIKVYVRRIDGTLVEQTDQITPTNARKGEVTVKLKNSAFNKEGYALFQLDVSDSNGRITSSYATFKIGKGLISGEVIANTNEVEALKKIEEYIKKANLEFPKYENKINEFNQKTEEYKNEVVEYQGEVKKFQNIANSLQTQFDEAVANITNGVESTTNSEIVQARGGEVNLNRRLDKFDSQLDNNTNFTKKIIKAKHNTPTLINDVINQMSNNANSVINFNSVNGVIELESGIYEVDTIIMRSNITIKGQGIGKTIIKPIFSNIDKYIFDVNGTDTNNRLTNFELQDLSIMPSPSYQYAIAKEENRYLASVINFSYCSSCRLNNVIISGFKGHAINQVENYDCNLDNIQILGCGDSSNNSITFLNGTSDGCNAIHIDGYRFEGNSKILIESNNGKFQREIQFGIGKFEECGFLIKGSSNINIIGGHFTWSKTNDYLFNLETSSSTELYGIKVIGCSLLGENSYLCKNNSDGYIRFSGCNIKGFNKSFEGNKIDVTDNEIYSCLSPIFNITSENKVVNNKILATRGTDFIVILNGNNNIIALNENLYPITTKGCNVLGDYNEILFNKGFNAKTEGKTNWDASNNYQTTNGIRATFTPSPFRGALKYDVNTQKLSFYNGSEYKGLLDTQCKYIAPVNSENLSDIKQQFNNLITQLVSSGIMKSN